jgi:hypothetical protein
MAIDRREFLGALVVAPAALAGCGGGAAAVRADGGVNREAAPVIPPPDEAVAAVRSFPLGADAQPAFAFRAAAARAGEP